MSNYERNFDEKRDFIRMRVDGRAVITASGNSHEAVCIDLSSKGMQLKTEAAVTLGEQVEVEIISQHSQLPSLKATAEVIRVDAAEDGQGSVLGLTILSMN